MNKSKRILQAERKVKPDAFYGDRYVIQATEKSHCPTGHSVDLLCPAGLQQGFDAYFYICWECRKVFQAGVGEVSRED